MWYFAWILGVLLACAFGIINVLWLEAQESLDQHTSVLDPLTKLPNRVEFLRLLEQEIEQQKNRRGTFSLLMISLDGLQSIAESPDDEKIDERVLTVCQVIEQETRRSVDTVARYDAKTFVALMNSAHYSVAEATAKRICATCAEKFAKSPQPVVNIGIAEYQHDRQHSSRQTLETLLQNVDQTLKKAQKAT